MAKSNKNNTNIIDGILKTVNPTTKTLEWNGVNIEVKNRLNIKEVSEFVSFVSEVCFTSLEEYVPEIFEFAVSVATIEKYTNFKMPESVEDKYSLVMFTDIVSKVTGCIDATEQYANVVDAAKEKIDYKIETNINLVKKQINELFTAMQSVLGKLDSAFQEVESMDIRSMMEKLKNEGLVESELLENYVEDVSK